jgi:hypothetical protein
MQLGSFIIRKDGGDIGIITDISDGEIRFIIVKGRWAYETGAKSWCRTEVFLDRWEAIAE